MPENGRHRRSAPTLAWPRQVPARAFAQVPVQRNMDPPCRAISPVAVGGVVEGHVGSAAKLAHEPKSLRTDAAGLFLSRRMTPLPLPPRSKTSCPCATPVGQQHVSLRAVTGLPSLQVWTCAKVWLALHIHVVAYEPLAGLHHAVSLASVRLSWTGVPSRAARAMRDSMRVLSAAVAVWECRHVRIRSIQAGCHYCMVGIVYIMCGRVFRFAQDILRS